MSLRGAASFLARPPDRPQGASPRALEHRTGVSYETAWARRYPVRLVRAMVLDNLTIPLVRVVASPKVLGRHHLEPIEGPVIVVANHASHLDASILLAALPEQRRHQSVVAAAADYFFDRHWKAAISAFGLGAIPMERVKVNRKSADAAAALVEAGWSLLIFPEGGRSPDGWGQEFKGGAAYLSKRCRVPVVPAHIRGTRSVLPKGGDGVRARLRPATTEVRFGRAMSAGEGEDARRFSGRIETAIAVLADEAETDWWSAKLRGAGLKVGDPSAFRGPEVAPWRRSWELPESADPVSRRARGSEPARWPPRGDR